MELRITLQEFREWGRTCTPFIAIILAVITGLWAGSAMRIQPLPQPDQLNFSFNAATKQPAAVSWQRPQGQADLFRIEQPPAAVVAESVPLKEDAPAITTELHLQFIIFNGERKICKINDQFFQEGQQGNGFRVKSITRTGVWLEPAAPFAGIPASDQSYFIYLGQKLNLTTASFSGVN
jgi:hypothetical protein